METAVPGRPRFDPAATELLDRLTAEGHRLFWNREWREYAQIEREIAACDAVLAIVDETWASSTWMAGELDWAAGGPGVGGTGNPRIQPIPVFFYPIDSERLLNCSYPFGVPGSRVLDRDVGRAVEQVNEVLGERFR